MRHRAREKIQFRSVCGSSCGQSCNEVSMREHGDRELNKRRGDYWVIVMSS